MRYLKASALAFIIAAPGLAFASTAQAASECPVAAGVFNVASGGACLFPLRIEGVIASSSILHKPEHGTLTQLNASTFEYTAKAGYVGTDTFSVQATGKGPTASGTSVITMTATVQ